QQPLTRRERLLKELNEFFTRIIVRALGAVAPEQAVVMKVLAGTAFDDLLKLNDPQGLYAFCLDCGGI
ncbi:MAG TPA: hypothetical protein VLT56_02970, partial [Desulfobacterales bacterium]|nr:hypothetical protein [Desulfobacterales bacterium]